MVVVKRELIYAALNGGWSIEAVANMFGDTIQTTEKVLRERNKCLRNMVVVKRGASLSSYQSNKSTHR